jgi:hypothetical protein
MPDRRIHRGPHPDDEKLFAPSQWETLRRATAELSWLLSRGYAPESALKLVGDRHALVARQRLAVARCACGDAEAASRARRLVPVDAFRRRALWLDGYNVLTSIEAALAGGVILAARDGAYRDMASMHGTYRKVAETLPALRLLGEMLNYWGPRECVWYLDRPVSNSGRLKTIIEQLASSNGWAWRVALVNNPDQMLIAATASRAAAGMAGSASDAARLEERMSNGAGNCERPIVATADSIILDHCGEWFNLAREVISKRIPQARIIPLGEA